MKTKSLAASLLLTVATLAGGFQTPPEWVKYASVEGRYNVLVPQEPKLSTREATAPTGKKLMQYMAETFDSNSGYVVGYFDILSGMTFSLDKARDGVVAAVKGTLLSDDAISLGGHPGREFKISFKIKILSF